MIAAPRNVLLIGFGNPGRLDDGLGPALAAEIERVRSDDDFAARAKKLF